MEVFSNAKVRVNKEEGKNEVTKQEPQDVVALPNNTTTRTNENVLKHSENLIADSKKEPTLRCWRCGSEFEEQNALKAHIFQYHPDGALNRLKGPVKLFKCDGCDKVYRSTKYLLKHMIMHDHMGKGLLNHECKVCGLKFLYHSNLNKHMQRHERRATIVKIQQTKDTRKLYECKICYKHFVRKKYYDRHAKIHKDMQDKAKARRAVTSTRSSSNNAGRQHVVRLESSAAESVEYIITEILEDEKESEDGQFAQEAVVSTGSDMEHVTMKMETEDDFC